MEVEILSTCVKEFHSNWNCNYYRPGKTFESGGIPVLRFKVRKRNVHAFDEVNLKLMNGDMPLTAKEEETFVDWYDRSICWTTDTSECRNL